MEKCLVFDGVDKGRPHTNMAHETVIQELNDLNLGQG
jgi:hypothetical protein